jgi:hypothetical protein
MAITGKLYTKLYLSAFNKELDLLADDIKVALCTSSYTPSQTTHDYFDDITNEVSSSGTGYTSGGATLGTKTHVASSTTVTFDSADVTWTTSTITARYAIIYLSTGTASTSPLIGYIDFGADISSSSSDLTIAWNASGIFTVTVS